MASTANTTETTPTMHPTPSPVRNSNTASRTKKGAALYEITCQRSFRFGRSVAVIAYSFSGANISQAERRSRHATCSTLSVSM
jgi:hypothetical protein